MHCNSSSLSVDVIAAQFAGCSNSVIRLSISLPAGHTSGQYRNGATIENFHNHIYRATLCNTLHEAHSPQYCVSLVRGEVGLTLSQGAATVTSATTAINDIIDISTSTMFTIYRIYVAHLAATERRWAICFGDVFSPPALREAQARRAYIYLLIFVYFLYY